MDPILKEAAEQVIRELAAKGRLIEAGWASYQIMAIPKDAGPHQRSETRIAFYAGAHHLFNSLLLATDPGHEVTDSDLVKMDLVHKELEAFGKELEENLKAWKAQKR
jgi:hypothetical protein